MIYHPPEVTVAISISGFLAKARARFHPQNPTWRSLDFGIMPDRLDTSVSCFVVKIWGGKEDVYQLLIEWKVCLDGLKYLGQQVIFRLVAGGSLL